MFGTTQSENKNLTIKIIFPQGTKREKIENILHRYAPNAIINVYYEDLEIGCNHIAMASVDIDANQLEQLEKIQKDIGITRIEKCWSLEPRKTHNDN